MIDDKPKPEQNNTDATPEPVRSVFSVFSRISRDRWIGLGLLFTVLLVVFLVLIMPVISMGLEFNESKNDLVFRIQRYNRVIASKAAVIENAKKIRQQHELQGYFNTNNTEALASADLQKIIKSSISSVGGQLTSTQALPSKKNVDFTRVSVKVRMTGSIEVLRSVLHEIEKSTPLIIIEQLDIRPVRGRRNRKTRKIEPSSKLNINFQAASFMRKGL